MAVTSSSGRARRGADSRSRIVTAAATLLQRGGYESMSLKELGRSARVSAGSLYHFFPGGKEQIALEAIGHADAEFAVMLAEATRDVTDVEELPVRLADVLATHLEHSAWRDGCPLTAAALETAGYSECLREAVDAAFTHWAALVRRKLVDAGLAEDLAAELSLTIMNCLEGAEVAAQVSRSGRPLRLAGKHLSALVAGYR